MVGHPCAIVAIDTPDGNRWADHVLRDIARHTLRLRGDCPFCTLVTKPSGYLLKHASTN